MLESIITYDKSGTPTLTIKAKGELVLRIEIFPDKSHPGIHLFLTPLGKAVISESPSDCRAVFGACHWTHELLR